MACNEKSVTTSLTVSFSISSDKDSTIVAEVDGYADGLNSGNTSFSPGDRVGFLVFPGSGVSISDVSSSLGSISGAGSRSITVTETFTFIIPDSIENSLSKNPIGSVSLTWIGKTPPGNLQQDGQKLKLALQPGTCYAPKGFILKAEYSTTAYQYYLNHTPPSGESEYEILILIVGEVT